MSDKLFLEHATGLDEEASINRFVGNLQVQGIRILPRVFGARRPLASPTQRRRSTRYRLNRSALQEIGLFVMRSLAVRGNAKHRLRIAAKQSLAARESARRLRRFRFRHPDTRRDR
jgi:hypothetical protein